MNSAAFSPRCGRRDGELQRQKGLAGAGRSHHQGARAPLDAAAEQRVEFADAAREHIAGEARLVLAGDEARKHLHAAFRDDEVVKAAPERLAAILDHPQAAALGAIVGRQLLQADHPMGEAVNGLVVGVGGQVVEQQHRRALAREVVLHGQDLAAVAQGALRQKADLRQAVDHDADRLRPVDGLEHGLGGLAELEIGRVEQALLVLVVEQALRRHELEHVNAVAEGPAMRRRAVAQLRSVSDMVM